MTTLLSLERFLPPHRYGQETVARWVEAWLRESPDPNALRLLPVYEAAGVAFRASVAPIEDVFSPRDFEAQNDRYCGAAREAGVDVARRALESAGLAAADVGLLVSASCTGFMIPAVDAYVAEALGMGPRLTRLPITESGCAGGVVALARAADHLAAFPDRAALVLALEFSSLTFQRWDYSAANIVSAAIFGDGGAAAVLVGSRHPRARSGGLARLMGVESVFFPGTTHLMGFRLRNPGLQIILDRELTPFIEREVEAGVDGFLERHGLTRRDVTRWILHPGGRKIIEAMGRRLGLTKEDLRSTETVLEEHGNMSSVTVLFVLDDVMRRARPSAGEKGLLAAFGPGFGAEFALVEFCG